LQLLIISEVFDIDSDSSDDEELDNDENAENLKLSQNVIQSLTKGDDEANDAMKQIRKCLNKGSNLWSICVSNYLNFISS
jgi:hypothetical protein